jgi:hypothetical protein
MAYDDLTAKLVSENATLRAELSVAHSRYEHWFKEATTLRAEVERLRAALREIASWEPGASAVARAALAQEKKDV